jgi:hypothetical protein
MTGNGDPAPPKSTASPNAITQTSGADADVLKQHKTFATESVELRHSQLLCWAFPGSDSSGRGMTGARPVRYGLLPLL